MLVKRMWIGRPNGRGMRARYEGWFLFGLIPLYIKQTQVKYLFKLSGE